MRLRHSIALSAILALPATVFAQAPVRDTTRLPGVTTTATRSATTTLSVPLAVTKIDAADLRSTTGYGVEDALKMVPGVIAQSRYGTSDVRLVIRGYGARGAGDRSNSGTSRGVRVILDGFPETEPDGRTAFDHVDLATATSLEVVRSNASSLWGNAAGGVLSLSSVPTVSQSMFDVQPIVGAFGLMRIAARMATPLGSTGVMWASFTNTTFEGWRKHSDARRAVANVGAVGNLSEKTRLGVYAVASNNLFRIPGPLTQAEMDADPTQANPTYLTRDERRYNRLGRLGFSVDHQLSSSASLSSSLYINPKYLQRSERGTYRDFTRYHIGGSLLARKTQAIGSSQNRFTLGVDEAVQDGSIQFYTLTANTRGALSDNKVEGAQNLGVFLQDELTLNDKLSLLLGARWDQVTYNYRAFFNPAAVVKAQSKQFDRVSPKLGINWKLTGTSSVYANMGGGLEVPAGNETDQPPTAGSSQGLIPGALLNPLLDAISSTSMEVGYKSVGTSLAGGALTLGYDVALYDISVENEIIPYNGGRYYQTAASASRRGLELGVTAMTRMGVFAGGALSFNDHKYDTYVYDSSIVATTTPGSDDRSGNDVMGVPKMLFNGELGVEMPGFRKLRFSANLEHSSKYWADDRNTIEVPSFTIIGLKAELRNPILAKNGWGLRGFLSVHNLTDAEYVGSAFLNPDPSTGGNPGVFEPGMPRAVTVSFSLGRL